MDWLVGSVGNPKGVNRKVLESVRGFMVYVGRTYPALVPYMKGLHLTLDGWRPGRDADGWKLMRAKLQAHIGNEELGGQNDKDNDPLAKVHAVT